VFKIVSNTEIALNVHEIVLEAPEIARTANPGQFIIVMVGEKSERIPLTLADWDEEAGTITMVVLEVGKSTGALVALPAGESVAHVVGPLGKPIEIGKFGRVAVTGGCYGIGAVVRTARALREAGNHVTAVVEARSHDMHYYSEKFQSFCDEVVRTTTDGSVDFKGHAVDVIESRLKGGEKLDLVIAVGCVFMMMLTAKATEPFGVKTLVSLNPIMLDGTGMCGACRCTVGGEMKFACVDGPFFDAHEVDWMELRDRRAAYSMLEKTSVAQTAPVARVSGRRQSC
jgi:ferredoxin--NADP+ reductase